MGSGGGAGWQAVKFARKMDGMREERRREGDEAIDAMDHEAIIADENGLEAIGEEEGRGSGDRGGDLGDEVVEQGILGGRRVGDDEQGRRMLGVVLVRRPHRDARGGGGLSPARALEAHEDAIGDGGALWVSQIPAIPPGWQQWPRGIFRSSRERREEREVMEIKSMPYLERESRRRRGGLSRRFHKFLLLHLDGSDGGQ